MKKILKSTVVALAVLTSACALASCGGKEKPNDTSTQITTPSDKPDTNPDTNSGSTTDKPDESIEESTEESTEEIDLTKFIFNKELLSLNLRDGEQMPEDSSYEIYAEIIVDNEAKYIKATDDAFIITDIFTEVKIVLVDKTKEPTAEGAILAHIDEITVVGQNLVFNNTNIEVEPKFEDYTFESNKLIYNLKPTNNIIPSEYDVYAYYWYGESLPAKFVKAENDKLSLDNRVNSILLVIVKKGDTPNWDSGNIIAQTENLEIDDHKIILAVDAPKERAIHVNTSLIKWNLFENQKMPEDGSYDIYAHIFGNGITEKFLKVENETIRADERYNGIVVLLVKKGTAPTFDKPNFLCKTTNARIEGTNVIFDNDNIKPYNPTVEYTFNQDLIKWNLKNGKLMPNKYDLYLHVEGLYGEHNQLVEEPNKVKIDPRTSEAYFVLVDKGHEFTMDYNHGCLGRTINVTLGGFNKILFNINEDPQVEYVQYSVDCNDIPYNLKQGNKIPEEMYDTYLYWWITNEINGFYHITSNSVSLPKNAIGAKYVLVKSGMNASWDNSLCETVNATMNTGEITLPVKAPERIDITFDSTLIEYNLKEDHKKPTNIEYDIWARAFNTNNDQYYDTLISGTDNTLGVYSSFNRIVFVYVKKGTGLSWEGVNYLAQTNDLTIEDNTVKFPRLAPVEKTFTFRLEDIPFNIKDGNKLPIDGNYDIYLHVWGYNYDLINLVNGLDDIKLDTRVEGAQFVVVAKGHKYTTDYNNGCLGITTNAIIDGNAINLEKKATTITFDNSLYQYNMEVKQSIPTENYDIWIHVYNDYSNFEDVKLEANADSVIIHSDYKNVIFVFVKAGETEIVWENGNVLAQTLSLEIKNGKVEFKYGTPVTKTFTFTPEDISLNFKDGKTIPDNTPYDIYLHVWGYNYDNFLLVNGRTEAVFDSRVTGAQFVIVSKDVDYTTDYNNGCIAMTTDATINGTKIELSKRMVTITFDNNLYQYNMKDKQTFPSESYVIFAHLFNDGNEEQKDILIANDATSLKTLSIYNHVIFVFAKAGTKEIVWDKNPNYLGETITIDIINNEVSFKYNANEVIYTFDKDEIGKNLKDGKKLPEDGNYDIYIHYWGHNIDNSILVTNANEVKLDNRLHGAQFVVVTKGSPLTYDYANGCIGITTNGYLVGNTIKLNVYVEVDPNRFQFNMKDGQSMPTGEYEVYGHFYGDNNVSEDLKIDGTKFEISSLYRNVVIVFVKKGTGHLVWDDNDHFIAQTKNLEIKNGWIILQDK